MEVHSRKSRCMRGFDGSDPEPDGWMFNAERYFKIHQLSDEEKQSISIIAFVEKALKWFRWVHERLKIEVWNGLKKGIFKIFQPSQKGSLCARFLAVKQLSACVWRVVCAASTFISWGIHQYLHKHTRSSGTDEGFFSTSDGLRVWLF